MIPISLGRHRLEPRWLRKLELSLSVGQIKKKKKLQIILHFFSLCSKASKEKAV